MAAAGDSGKDFEAHKETYAGFLTLFKVSTIASLVVGAIVILLIAN